MDITFYWKLVTKLTLKLDIKIKTVAGGEDKWLKGFKCDPVLVLRGKLCCAVVSH